MFDSRIELHWLLSAELSSMAKFVCVLEQSFDGACSSRATNTIAIDLC